MDTARLQTEQSAPLGANPPPQGTWVTSAAAWTAVVVAVACAVNAYSYTLVSANPLIQSDVWRYLDGFLGRFLERGFFLRDVFLQEAPTDTNFPLHKLFLFLNARYFALDLRLDGILAVLSAVASVLILTRASSGRPFARWTVLECWLLAALALVTLSLNSTNLFTWPLAGMWFMPVMLALAFFAVLRHVHWRGSLAIAFLAGVLLDEFAIPVVAAGMVGLAASGLGRRGLGSTALALLAGLALSRGFYGLIHLGVDPVEGAAGIQRSAAVFLSPEIWRAVVIPLADSLVHDGNLRQLFPASFATVRTILATLLALAHAWFWWRVWNSRRMASTTGAAIHMAAATMALFYALVAGIVMQRVGQFGFDYLHQPRYVLFYQLQLAAIAILLYRESCTGAGVAGRRIWPWMVGASLSLLVALQAQLAAMAWPQSKYISAYYQQSAHQMGALAGDPAARLECLPIVRICEFPVEKRQRIMGLLVARRLNLFSPGFQSLHRLYPGPLPAPAMVHRQGPDPVP
jgi:hypothetical protein